MENGVQHTFGLLLLVARDGANNRVVLALYTVHGTLGVTLCLRGLVFGLPSGVFLFSRLLPRLGTQHIAYGFDGGALRRVELAAHLTEEKSQ